jgi:glutamyl-Q tRNA(Asp) synthetase
MRRSSSGLTSHGPPNTNGQSEECRLIPTTPPTGRFAPSPTGPLHFGSLVTAVGSWLFARRAGGRWLIRIEDLDEARLVAGSDRQILDALNRFGLEQDGEPVYQSHRRELYCEALESLRSRNLVFDCGCSRADLVRTGSAPAEGDERDAAVYPGTCRHGLPAGKTPRSIRFRAPDVPIGFNDLIRGRHEESLATTTGDFVLRRADGVFAYQLAVVVDDAAQGVTDVVRGGDLLSSTARQIALQRALGYPTPRYAHLPLVTRADGSKLGKRDGAVPLPDLAGPAALEVLRTALTILGVREATGASASAMLAGALGRFDPAAIPWERACPIQPRTV